jgi:hypothetical protein
MALTSPTADAKCPAGPSHGRVGKFFPCRRPATIEHHNAFGVEF